MLDAILEYTTTGYIPTVFTEENQKKHKTVKTTNNMVIGELPRRMEGNHLSRHSKVLNTDGPAGNFKPLPLCPVATYAVPIPLNESASM